MGHGHTYLLLDSFASIYCPKFVGTGPSGTNNEVIERFGGAALLSLEEVGIDVEGQRCRSVTKPAAHDVNVGASLDPQSGGGMAQSMPGDASGSANARSIDNRLVASIEVARYPGAPHLGREYQTMFLPEATAGQAQLTQLPSMPTKHSRRARR